MYGLSMFKRYAIEILSGIRKSDVRAYPTNKRGRIAIVDTKTLSILGTVTLYGIRRITYKEYCLWHGIQVDDGYKNSGNYYEYLLKDPEILSKPIKLSCKKAVWIDVGDLSNYPEQLTLF